jgi:hypothetical protein
MTELLKLPSGDYVDPLLVTRIVFLGQDPPTVEPGQIYIGARVVVWTGADQHLIPYANNEAAKRAREEIGNAVNEARRAFGSGVVEP